MVSGADRDRTGDPLLAKQVLSQLSYRPEDVTSPEITNLAGPGQARLAGHRSYSPPYRTRSASTSGR
jgi:hypothetical protein